MVLQVVTEPPNGLRPNLRASFSRITDAMLSECSHPVRPSFMLTARCLLCNR